MHVGFFEQAAALAVVARRAGRNDVDPIVFAAQVAGNNMINGQVICTPAAVLAGVIIAPEHLAAGEF